MKSILIVEDDEHKSDELISIVTSTFPSIELVLKKNVSAAIECVNDSVFHLIVLDMALPSHATIAGEGSALQLPTGGFEVLFELKSLGRNDPCVIITQYPEIEICQEFYSLKAAPDAMESNYGIRVLGCIDYVNSGEEWRAKLKEVLKILCES